MPYMLATQDSRGAVAPARARPLRRAATAALAACTIVWSAGAFAALPSEGYADLVEQVSPSVAFISTTSKPKQAERPDLPFQVPPGSPMEEFFKRFFEGQMQPRGPVTGLGSGFVIDPSGLIVTNNHVVDGADDIKVKLPGNPAEMPAKVVGVDPQTDLALLKVEAPAPLPAVRFGDSDKLRPGDVVLAVGNPFGLGGTVTAGIVSARNRDIHSGPYDDFIQTDAAINRGNSGGPLFDTRGQVVGVNSAIFSPNGGSVGIGFAIPSNLARDVVAQLQAQGRVERGWLGVSIQPVSPEIAEALKLPKPEGALVASLAEDGPAAKAGVRQGDVILEFAGKPVEQVNALPRMVAAMPAGERAPLKLWRDGRAVQVNVTVGQLKQQAQADAQRPARGSETAAGKLGVQLAELTPEARRRLELPRNVSGVLVAAVDPEGRAAARGVRPGDVIQQVGSERVKQPADVVQALNASAGKSVLLLVNRGGDARFVAIDLADA